MKLRALLLAAPFIFASAARAAAFTPDQIEASIGAQRSAQYFYHAFKKDRDPSLSVPAWLDKSLEALHKREVWQDPDEGTLTEARLWTAAPMIVYEYLELVRRSFPPNQGGQSKPPLDSLTDYEESRRRLTTAVDRLHRAKLGASLGGRGGRITALFRRMVPAMKAAEQAAIRKDERKHAATVTGVAALMNEAYAVLMKAP